MCVWRADLEATVFLQIGQPSSPLPIASTFFAGELPLSCGSRFLWVVFSSLTSSLLTFLFFDLINRFEWLLDSVAVASSLPWSTPWVRMCRCILPLVVKAMLQIRHLKGLNSNFQILFKNSIKTINYRTNRSPECMSICLSKLLAELKVLPHSLHVWEWSEGLCCRMWIVNVCWESSLRSQTGHLYSSGRASLSSYMAHIRIDN